MPRIDVNDVSMYYEEGGAGPPLIFVHGGFSCLESALDPPRPYDWSWEHDFANAVRFVWYDRRGCYRSSTSPFGYDLEGQATDLDALLDRLGIASTHLIGSSAGGPIALLFAATRPHRTRSLILVGTGLALFPRRDRAGETIRRLIALLERDGPETAFDQRPTGIELSLSALWEREEMEARGRLDEWLEDQRALAAQAQGVPRQERVRRNAIELHNIAAYLDADLNPYAERVEAPTLVLHGSEDRDTPPGWGEELAHAISTAQFRLFEGGRHGLPFRGPMSEGARRATIDFAARHD